MEIHAKYGEFGYSSTPVCKKTTKINRKFFTTIVQTENLGVECIKLQEHNLCCTSYCFKQTFKNEGVLSFYKGTWPRMARVLLTSQSLSFCMKKSSKSWTNLVPNNLFIKNFTNRHNFERETIITLSYKFIITYIS